MHFKKRLCLKKQTNAGVTPNGSLNYVDFVQDCPIPYTEASMHCKKKTYRGSADDMK